MNIYVANEISKLAKAKRTGFCRLLIRAQSSIEEKRRTLSFPCHISCGRGPKIKMTNNKRVLARGERRS